MNDWLIAYTTSAVHVTLLSGVALTLHSAVSRRRADAWAPVLLTTLLLNIGLTAAAFLPLPGSWAIPNNTKVQVQAREPQSAAAATATDGLVVPLRSWSANIYGLLRQLRLGNSVATNPLDWRRCLALAAATTIGGLLVRLGGGVWTVRRLLRRTIPICDSRVTSKLERLRGELGCSPAVTVVDCSLISSAATIGWRRPVLLLSSQWRDWSDSELMAALAHELVHVVRRHYLCGIVTRIALAIHFYNPLVRCLASRLFLAQEATADRAAAEVVGGPERYPVALSQLALRQDQRPSRLPMIALAFTSSTFLLRRIQMLQTKDGRKRSVPLLQGAVVGTLVLLAFAASVVRVPVTGEEPPQPVRVANKTDSGSGTRGASDSIGGAAVRRSSIDPVLLPVSRHGIAALRLNVLFGRQEMQSLTGLLDGLLAQKLREMGVGDKVQFSIADLSHAVGPISVRFQDPSGPAGHRGSLTFGLSAVQSMNPLPVKEVAVAVDPGTQVTSTDAGSVIETRESLFPIVGPMKQFAMPDDRTVLPGVGLEGLQKLKQRDAQPQPWMPLWGEVEQHMLAFVVDVATITADAEAAGVKMDAWTSEQRATVVLAQHTNQLAVGLDWRGDELHIDAIVECKTADGAAAIAAGTREITAVLQEGAAGDQPDEQAVMTLYHRIIQALSATQPQIDGTRLRLSASTELKAAEILALARHATE